MELELKDLTKKYKEKIAVNHVNAVFQPGTYGLLGANGAGKTTLMRMICNVLTPSSGEITMDGNCIHTMGENYRSLLGYLPQNFGYYPDYTAKEFMHYIAALKGIPKSAARKQTKQLLELVSLASVADQKIKTFSGGMKQRLGIADALIKKPKLLILDEPTNGLDPNGIKELREMLKIISKEQNISILISSHILSEIENICDEILIINNGKIVKDFGIEEVKYKNISLEEEYFKVIDEYESGDISESN